MTKSHIIRFHPHTHTTEQFYTGKMQFLVGFHQPVCRLPRWDSFAKSMLKSCIIYFQPIFEVLLKVIDRGGETRRP